jgi:hypothetical protein
MAFKWCRSISRQIRDDTEQRHAHGLRDSVKISIGAHWRGAGDGEAFGSKVV